MSQARHAHLDNAAACAVDEAALDAFVAASRNLYANQEGACAASLASAKGVVDAGRALGEALAPGSRPGVFWCGTGSDAVMAAVEASMRTRPGNIVSSDAEHASLAKAVERAAHHYGVELRKARLRRDGRLDIAHLESLLDKDSALLAVHHVNSETGAVQDLPALRRLLDAKAPESFFFADTAQSAFKLPLPWREAKLDFACVSGVKIGAPCGAALLHSDLYQRRHGKALKFLRMLEHRFGRCPAAACVALAARATALAPGVDAEAARMAKLNAAFREALRSKLGEKVVFTMKPEEASPFILHLLLPGVMAATIVRMLSEKGFCVSAGSACDAESKTPSRVLLALGLRRDEAYSALRLSFWRDSSEEDAAPFAEALAFSLADY